MLYNTDGTLQKLTDAKLRDTLYFYLDAAKNLSKIIDANLGEYLFTRDNNGNILTSQDPDLRTTTMSYDGKNRLVRLIDSLGKETLFFLNPAEFGKNPRRKASRNGADLRQSEPPRHHPQQPEPGHAPGVDAHGEDLKR